MKRLKLFKELSPYPRSVIEHLLDKSGTLPQSTIIKGGCMFCSRCHMKFDDVHECKRGRPPVIDFLRTAHAIGGGIAGGGHKERLRQARQLVEDYARTIALTERIPQGQFQSINLKIEQSDESSFRDDLIKANNQLLKELEAKIDTLMKEGIATRVIHEKVAAMTEAEKQALAQKAASAAVPTSAQIGLIAQKGPLLSAADITELAQQIGAGLFTKQLDTLKQQLADILAAVRGQAASTGHMEQAISEVMKELPTALTTMFEQILTNMNIGARDTLQILLTTIGTILREKAKGAFNELENYIGYLESNPVNATDLGDVIAKTMITFNRLTGTQIQPPSAFASQSSSSSAPDQTGVIMHALDTVVDSVTGVEGKLTALGSAFQQLSARIPQVEPLAAAAAKSIAALDVAKADIVARAQGLGSFEDISIAMRNLHQTVESEKKELRSQIAEAKRLSEGKDQQIAESKKEVQATLQKLQGYEQQLDAVQTRMATAIESFTKQQDQSAAENVDLSARLNTCATDLASEKQRVAQSEATLRKITQERDQAHARSANLEQDVKSRDDRLLEANKLLADVAGALTTYEKSATEWKQERAQLAEQLAVCAESLHELQEAKKAGIDVKEQTMSELESKHTGLIALNRELTGKISAAEEDKKRTEAERTVMMRKIADLQLGRDMVAKDLKEQKDLEADLRKQWAVEKAHLETETKVLTNAVAELRALREEEAKKANVKIGILAELINQFKNHVGTYYATVGKDAPNLDGQVPLLDETKRIMRLIIQERVTVKGMMVELEKTKEECTDALRVCRTELEAKRKEKPAAHPLAQDIEDEVKRLRAADEKQREAIGALRQQVKTATGLIQASREESTKQLAESKQRLQEFIEREKKLTEDGKALVSKTYQTVAAALEKAGQDLVDAAAWKQSAEETVPLFAERLVGRVREQLAVIEQLRQKQAELEGKFHEMDHKRVQNDEALDTALQKLDAMETLKGDLLAARLEKQKLLAEITDMGVALGKLHQFADAEGRENIGKVMESARRTLTVMSPMDIATSEAVRRQDEIIKTLAPEQAELQELTKQLVEREKTLDQDVKEAQEMHGAAIEAMMQTAADDEDVKATLGAFSNGQMRPADMAQTLADYMQKYGIALASQMVKVAASLSALQSSSAVSAAAKQSEEELKEIENGLLDRIDDATRAREALKEKLKERKESKELRDETLEDAKTSLAAIAETMGKQKALTEYADISAKLLSLQTAFADAETKEAACKKDIAEAGDDVRSALSSSETSSLSSQLAVVSASDQVVQTVVQLEGKEEEKEEAEAEEAAETSRETLSRVAEGIPEMEKRLQSLVATLSDQKEHIARQELKVQTAEAASRKSIEELKRYTHQIEDLEMKLSTLKTGAEKEIASTKKEKDEANAARRILSAEKETLRDQVAKHAKQQTGFETTILDQSRKIGDLQIKLDEAKRNLNEAIAAAKRAEAVEVKEKGELSVCNRQLIALTAKADAIKKDHESEIVRLNEKYETTHQTVTEKSRQIAGLQEEKKTCEGTKAGLQVELERCGTENAALRAELEKCRSESVQEKEKYNADRQSYLDNTEVLANSIGEKDEEIERLKAGIDTLQGSIQGSSDKIQALEAALQEQFAAEEKAEEKAEEAPAAPTPAEPPAPAEPPEPPEPAEPPVAKRVAPDVARRLQTSLKGGPRFGLQRLRPESGPPSLQRLSQRPTDLPSVTQFQRKKGTGETLDDKITFYTKLGAKDAGIRRKLSGTGFDDLIETYEGYSSGLYPLAKRAPLAMRKIGKKQKMEMLR